MLLAILLIFNVYFAYAIYNLNTENKEVIGEINYTNYATLHMFKQIIPADAFKEFLLPEIEVALEDGTLDESEWANIKLKIASLKKSENIDFHELFREEMRQELFGSTLKRVLNNLGDDVTTFGGALKKDLEKLAGKHECIFDDEGNVMDTQNKNPQDKKKQTVQDTNKAVTL